ncbi:GDP-mannose 4,6-dehydratase [Lysobacter arenosi]|uniref:GDP-mannose 4,6-dehydratase n=1 Tax=Lysobacter arenosi TaxID=2795387 RepID=A0ABX7R6H2_9GAMM|nr:GDP-mannose 4,6-dehydratase [Lysobacter arenosi]QSX73644.1 GDP-mannose 4,6-dehydratase [Lysobacter arenosi]
MSSVGKRVLLTGASGFTGRYMAVELASRGYQVVGLGGRAPEGLEHQDAANAPLSDMLHVDLLDADDLKRVLAEVRPQVVIHLAAVAFVGHGSANDFYNVNLIGTRNLLEAISSAGQVPECVLLASSANVYGNASEGALAETTPAAPANDYAVSKLAMEYAARLWSDRLPIVLARPFNYTGVGQSEQFVIPKIVAHFRRRAPSVELGNLDVWRDFSDVRAVAGAYARLIQAPDAIGQVVNVCSGTAHSLREVISLCETLTGHSIRVDVNPAFVRASEVRMLRGENDILRRLVGDWSCPPLRETLEWMLSAN